MSISFEINKILSVPSSDWDSLAGRGGPPTPVAEGFAALQEDFRTRFGIRAPGSYTILNNLEEIFGSQSVPGFRGKFPYVQFEPNEHDGDKHVPVLVVYLLFSPDQGGVYLLLSDLRPLGTGPDESVKRDQRKQLRSQLQSRSSLAWNEQYWGTPDQLAEQIDDDRWFATATIVYKYWDFGGQTKKDEELVKDIDAMLRLRELYVERFAERSTFSSLDASRNNEVKTEGRATTAPDSTRSGPAIGATGEPPTAKNLILYGPPGTGKTYSTTRRTLELCDEIEEGEELPEEEMRQKFHRLQEAGRVEFVTFHQSYGYEEFVEGIRPKIQGDDSEKGEVSGEGDIEYEYKRGAFKRIALAAASEGLYLTSHDQAFEQRWTGLQRAIEDDEVREVRSRGGYSYHLSIVDADRLKLERNEDDPNPTTYTVKKTTVKRWWDRQDKLGRKYEAIDSDTASRVVDRSGGYTQNWIVYRELNELDESELPDAHESRVSDSEDYSSRLKSAEDYLQERPRNLFYGFDDAKPYVLIIDEINRGNISKILGELITLLEPSKRLTCDDEMIVTLPHTEDKFAVPPNLHIIGTMNTADRSIALLDAALRRRFDYEEMMPDSSVVVEGLMDAFGVDELVELDDDERYLVELAPALLDTINERIRFLYDRDHQIGHSYFMKATSLEELRVAFIDRVIPLLQEYFYGTWNQIGLALGCPYDRKAKPKRKKERDGHAFEGSDYRAPMIKSEVLVEKDVLRMDHEDYEDQSDWRVHPEFADPSEIEDEGVDKRLKEFFEAVLPSDRLKQVKNWAYAERVLENGEQR